MLTSVIAGKRGMSSKTVAMSGVLSFFFHVTIDCLFGNLVLYSIKPSIARLKRKTWRLVASSCVSLAAVNLFLSFPFTQSSSTSTWVEERPHAGKVASTPETLRCCYLLHMLLFLPDRPPESSQIVRSESKPDTSSVFWKSCSADDQSQRLAFGHQNSGEGTDARL
jgi:hypothetical protein